MSFNSSESLQRFQRTQELLSKNKINRFNAFQNRLVNFDDTLLQPSENSDGVEEWERSAQLVDAHARIYGFCVDYIFEETVKINGGVHRTAYEEEKNESSGRRQRLGVCTLVSNEEDIKSHIFDNKVIFDPHFQMMKSKFDCSKFETLLLNNLSSNPNVDLVIDQIDQILTEECFISSDEVNLECILTFSCNEIQSLSLCQALENDQTFPTSSNDLITGLSSYPEPSFAVMEHNSSPEDFISIQEEADYEEDYFEIAETPSDNFPFLSSSTKVYKLKDYLRSNLSNPHKKQKIRDRSEPDMIIKTDIEDFRIENIEKNHSLKTINLDQFFIRKEQPMEHERGYEELRLSKLFTRNGSLQEIRRKRPRNEEPFAVDPLFNPEIPESFNMVSSGRLELNLRMLKELIENITQDPNKRTFRKVVDELANILPLNQAKSLSLHACFIIMLHLANEKGFIFEQTADCDFSFVESHKFN